MSPEQLAAAQEASRLLAIFVRVGIGLGFLVGLIAALKRWDEFTSLSGPIGHVTAAALGGLAIPPALFPFFWLVVRGGTLADIESASLLIYVYVGSFWSVLVAAISIRGGMRKTD